MNKKRALVAIAVGAFAITGAAFAYFTTGGSGTGTASVGTSTNLVLHATVAGTLYPGAPAQNVNITVDNSSSAAQRLGTVHLASITADSSHSTCSVTTTGANPDFTMADVPENQTIAGSSNGVVASAHGSVTMNDTGVSQDACKGATLTLNLTS